MLNNSTQSLILELLNIAKILLNHILVCSGYLWGLIDRKRALNNTQGVARRARLWWNRKYPLTDIEQQPKVASHTYQQQRQTIHLEYKCPCFVKLGSTVWKVPTGPKVHSLWTSRHPWNPVPPALLCAALNSRGRQCFLLWEQYL